MTVPSSREPGSGSHATGPAAGAPARRRRWLLPLLIAIALVVLLLLLLSRCGSSDGSTAASSGASSASSAASPTPTASSASPSLSSSPPTTSTTSTTSTSAAAGAAGAGAGGDGGSLTTAGGAAVLPLAVAGNADGGLASVTGQQVTATAVTVQSVPADEGFWVGTSETDRAWVQLAGAGESPFTVQPGQRVSFSATVVPNAPAFAASVGVEESEGASQLDAQGQHLEADRSSLTQAG